MRYPVGYDPVAFVAPKASDGNSEGLGLQTSEFKEMVRAPRKAGSEASINFITWPDWSWLERHGEIFRFDVGMISFRRAHPKWHLAVDSNEANELKACSIRKFKLDRLADCLISSCFVHIREPDADIFRLALDITRASVAQALFVDNAPMLVEVAEGLGILRILHTDYSSTCVKLASFGLLLAEGEGHETL